MRTAFFVPKASSITSQLILFFLPSHFSLWFSFCPLQLLLDAGAVELKNAIGILPKALQKKFDRRNSVILQDLVEVSGKED